MPFYSWRQRQHVSLLLRNLDGARPVRDASLAAVVEAASTVGPRGKQASFASHARALYVEPCEKVIHKMRETAAHFG